MNATIIGRVVDRGRLIAAISAAGCALEEMRRSHGTFWALLPLDTPRGMLAAIGAKLAGGHVVIDVAMELGGRGSGLYGSRTTYPEGLEEDTTGELREVLHDWRADFPNGGFDEDVAVVDLAWTLIDDDAGPDEGSDEVVGVGPLALMSEAPAESPVAAWARNVLDKLIEDGLVELVDYRRPYDTVIELLEKVDGEFPAHWGDRLIDRLVADEDVAEVYADREQVAAVVRAMWPR